jgi:hypothetical protein
MPGTHPTPAKRQQRREQTQAAQRSARAGVSKLSGGPFTRLVDGMTNWQRSRWAQAGYPGLQAHEVAAVEPFARMRRPKA